MPEFSTRNPTTSEFWDERFAQHYTPWDQGNVPHEVQTWIAHQTAAQAILIPGCGLAYEAEAFARAGHQVCAIDFSENAVLQARARLQQSLASPSPGEDSESVVSDEQQIRAQAPNRIDPNKLDPTSLIVQADFFEFIPPFTCNVIYERAFYCALPPTQRAEIVARWALLLRAGGIVAGYFVITDDPQDIKGPPFKSLRSGLVELMSAYFVLEQEQAVHTSIPVFQGVEVWMVWRRRADTI